MLQGDVNGWPGCVLGFQTEIPSAAEHISVFQERAQMPGPGGQGRSTVAPQLEYQQPPGIIGFEKPGEVRIHRKQYGLHRFGGNPRPSTK